MRRDVIGRVAPWLQMHWDWRAAGNFIAGGTGSGLLIVAMLGGIQPERAPIALGLGCIGAGLGCVWAEIGRPWRALNVFRHARTSWMAREAFAAAGVFACGAAAVLHAARPLQALLAIGAAAFLYSQARMLQAAKGIPAWRHPRVVPLICATGLAEGAGLLLLYGAVAPWPTVPRWLAWIFVLLPAARAACWTGYRRGVHARGAPRAALDVLDGLDRPLRAADVAATLLAAASLWLPAAVWPRIVAALVVLIAGWTLKATLIRRAAFNQGFALVLAPERGVGGCGPPARPGWNARAPRELEPAP